MLHKEMYKEISQEEEKIGNAIADSAFQVHKELEPGLLEKVYEVCFCHALSQKGFNVRRQIDIPIVFDGLIFKEGLRLDVMLIDLFICEFKPLEDVIPVWEAQLLSHLKLTKKRLGYLINFNVPSIKYGIKRTVI